MIRRDVFEREISGKHRVVLQINRASLSDVTKKPEQLDNIEMKQIKTRQKQQHKANRDIHLCNWGISNAR